MADALATGTRCAVLVGPYLSGKTTLLESLLFATGAIPRKGTVKDGNTVGDAAPESRARQMSVELSVGETEYLGDKWCFVDCPGSVELAQEPFNALMVADTAVIVCEASADKAMMLAPLFRFLDEYDIPHMLFINKMDAATESVQSVLAALQEASNRPLVLRQVPIREGEDITGYVDLVSERAYQYKPDGGGSDLISIPESIAGEEQTLRQQMLESLADFDDTLLEQLLEEVVPPTEEVYQQLTKDLRERHIVPVFLGAAEQDSGVRRLLKALRHETPSPEETAARHGIAGGDEAVVQVFKSMHAAHTGRLAISRVWCGKVTEGMTLNGKRVGGIAGLLGNQQKKISEAGPGDVVALSRMDEVATGDLLTASGNAPDGGGWPAVLDPVYGMAIEAENRADEVKLTGGLQRLNEEDPSITYRQEDDTRQLVLLGQGEIHLRIALEKLKNKYNVATGSARPRVPYKETIRKSVSQHARFKRQTGGHGMFGDVHVDIKPLPRGTGFEFDNTIVGGSVPRQYIPAVEAGAKEFLSEGPLGFPVVDVSVTLTDGQFHAVDSNEMSFKLAAREAMKEGMPKCGPVLLEPILKVDIDVPADFTNKVHGLISGRRGQILGFTPKEGWRGWDTVSAMMPQSEIHDLIIELRSLTLGVGTYHAAFDHLQELTGRLAEDVVEQHKEPAEAS